MRICCFGYSARTAVTISLLINVISNNILLNSSSSEFLKHILNENKFSYYWYLIGLQTILSLFAIAILIVFNNDFSSYIVRIQVRLLGYTLATLICEIVFIFLFVINPVHPRKIFDMIWQMVPPEKATEPAPVSFHVFLSALFVFFIGLKLHVTTITFGFVRKISEQNQILTDHTISDDEQFYSIEELVISSSPPVAPPSYDLCLMESDDMHTLHSQTPPPSYAAIFNFPADKNQASDV